MKQILFFLGITLSPLLFGVQGSFYRNNCIGYFPDSMRHTIKVVDGNVAFLSKEEYEEKEKEADENPISSVEIKDKCIKFTVLLPYVDDGSRAPFYKKTWFGLRKKRVGFQQKEYVWYPEKEGTWDPCSRFLNNSQKSRLRESFSKKCIDSLKKRPEFCEINKVPSLGQLNQNISVLDEQQKKVMLAGLTLSVVGSTLSCGVAGKSMPARLTGATLLTFSAVSTHFYGNIDAEKRELTKLRIQRLFLRDLKYLSNN